MGIFDKLRKLRAEEEPLLVLDNIIHVKKKFSLELVKQLKALARRSWREYDRYRREVLSRLKAIESTLEKGERKAIVVVPLRWLRKRYGSQARLISPIMSIFPKRLTPSDKATLILRAVGFVDNHVIALAYDYSEDPKRLVGVTRFLRADITITLEEEEIVFERETRRFHLL